MGIIKGYVKQVEDPTQSEHHITIRMLSYLELEEARNAGFARLSDKLKGMADIRAATAALPDSVVEEARARAKAAGQGDDLTGYDVPTLLKLGVTGWTYTEQLDVALFDERTALHVAREIVRFSNPSDADLGKGSSRSTST